MGGDVPAADWVTFYVPYILQKSKARGKMESLAHSRWTGSRNARGTGHDFRPIVRMTRH